MNYTLLCHIHVRTCSVIISLGLIISVYFNLRTVQIQYMYTQCYSYHIVTGAKPGLVPETGLAPVV